MDLQFLEESSSCRYYFCEGDAMFYAVRCNFPSFCYRKDSLEELKDSVTSGMRFWAKFDNDTD